MSAHTMPSWNDLGHAMYNDMDASKTSAMQVPDALTIQTNPMNSGDVIHACSDAQAQPPTALRAFIQQTRQNKAIAWYDLPAHPVHLDPESEPCHDGVPAGWYFIPAATLALDCERYCRPAGNRYSVYDLRFTRVYGKVPCEPMDASHHWSISKSASMLMINNIYPENNRMCYGSMDISYLAQCDAAHSIAGQVGIPSVIEMARYWDEFLMSKANSDLRYDDTWSLSRLFAANMGEVAKSMRALHDTSMHRRFYGTFMAQAFFLDAYYPSLVSDDDGHKALRLRLLGMFWDALLNAPVYSTASVQSRLAVFDPRHLITDADDATDADESAHDDRTDEAMASREANHPTPSTALRDRIVSLVSGVELSSDAGDDRNGDDDMWFIIADDQGEMRFTDKVSLVSLRIIGDDEHRINITEPVCDGHRDVEHVAAALINRMTMMHLYEPADLMAAIQALVIGDSVRLLIDNGVLVMATDPRNPGPQSNIVPTAG